MRKIPTLFARDFTARPAYVTEQVTPGCEWVTAGEGVATRKYDGVCCMLDDRGDWWARREIKPGKSAPPNYVLVEADPETGKRVGWEPVDQSGFAKWHADALQVVRAAGGSVAVPWQPGTFELIGPRVNGNPEGGSFHVLVRHAMAEVIDAPDRSFTEIRATVLALRAKDACEGIVFHHPDGRMAKIKARDFPRAQEG